jgi:hypothetical protein
MPVIFVQSEIFVVNLFPFCFLIILSPGLCVIWDRLLGWRINAAFKSCEDACETETQILSATVRAQFVGMAVYPASLNAQSNRKLVRGKESFTAYILWCVCLFHRVLAHVDSLSQ